MSKTKVKKYEEQKNIKSDRFSTEKFSYNVKTEIRNIANHNMTFWCHDKI